MSTVVNPFTGELDKTGSGGEGGGTTLAASYHLTESGATTTYSGINSSSSSTTDANWVITKTVLSGNNRETRTVYTATDTWDNRATASYTTSLAYSN